MIEDIKPKRLTALKSWGLVIIVITLIPLGYAFFYFQHRDSYLTAHYFRSLSGIEKQLNQGLKGMDYLLGFALVKENLSLNNEFKEAFCKKSDSNYCIKYAKYLKKHSLAFKNIKFKKQAKSCNFGTETSTNKESDVTCFLISGAIDNKKITVFDEKISWAAEIEKKFTKEDKTIIDVITKEVAKKLANKQTCRTDKLRKEFSEKNVKIIQTITTQVSEKLADETTSIDWTKEEKTIKNEVLEKLRDHKIKTKKQKLKEGRNIDITDDQIKKLIDTEREVLSVTVPIKDLIDPVPALEYFNRILLLDQSGNIVYRSGVDSLARTSNISAYDDFVRFENLSEYLHRGVTKELNLTKEGINTKEVNQITSHSRVRKATIAGISYLLYIQPFHAVRHQNINASNSQNDHVNTKAESGKEGSDRLAYIVGIIPTENNNKAIISLPLGRINILFFAVILIILLAPHFKLVFSGKRFMPSRTFMVWLAVTFPLLAIVLVVSVLSAYDYFQLKQSLDITAKKISNRINTNFKNEFDQFNKVLRPKFYLPYELYKDININEKRIPLVLPVNLSESSLFCYSSFEINHNANIFVSENRTYFLQNFDRLIKSILYPKTKIFHKLKFDKVCFNNQYLPHLPLFLCDNNKAHKDIMLQQPVSEEIRKYPIFELAFYLDSSGKQTGKQITYRSFPVNEVDVHRRDYFKKSYYHPENLSIWSEEFKYFSERIQTYDHGMKLTALSFPVVEYDEPDKKSECSQPTVLATIKLMHTFFQPVLPSRFGFAVIKGASGEVLYHSNDQRSLLENFYIETDEDKQIIAAAQMRHENFVSGKYNGRAHRFWVRPLENTAWSLVVFYDTELMELANIKTSIFSVGISVSIVFIILIILAFCYCLHKSVLQSILNFTPNGLLWEKLKNRLPWVSNHFNRVYMISTVIGLLFIFGLLAALLFTYIQSNQAKKIVKFNLIQIGATLLERHAALFNEISRVTELRNNYPEGMQYLDKDIFQFANYTGVLNGELNSFSFPNKAPNAWFAEYTDAEVSCSKKTKNDLDTIDELYQLMPNINSTDNSLQILAYDNATDSSWCFTESNTKKNSTVFKSGNNLPEFQLISEGYYTNTTNITPPVWWYFYLCLIPLLLYYLVKLTSVRLLGLGFDQKNNVGLKYIQGHHRLISANDDQTIKENYIKIANDTTGQFTELKSILFNLSRNQMINFTNKIALLQLINSRILIFDNKGCIGFSDPVLKEWVSNQPWEKVIREYEMLENKNLWSVMALPFYTIILLALVFLILSSGQVGELMLAMIPIILTGGIPFISSFIGKRN